MSSGYLLEPAVDELMGADGTLKRRIVCVFLSLQSTHFPWTPRLFTDSWWHRQNCSQWFADRARVLVQRSLFYKVSHQSCQNQQIQHTKLTRVKPPNMHSFASSSDHSYINHVTFVFCSMNNSVSVKPVSLWFLPNWYSMLKKRWGETGTTFVSSPSNTNRAA